MIPAPISSLVNTESLHTLGQTNTPSKIAIAVMGAGAVGCYYGGMLARTGHAVTLIARPQHVDAIRERGLRLDTQQFDIHVSLAASTDAKAVADAQLVLFSVKSTDTESAGELIRPHLRPDALVLCLQNGVDNADRLRAVLPSHEVAAVAVYVATEMAGPGHVKHHGHGELVIEPSRKSEVAARALIESGVPTEISSNVRSALWSKLILNCAYNALSAIAQVPYPQLVQTPGVKETMRSVVEECLAVAKADGVQMSGDVDATLQRITEILAPTQYSSTAQDVARGKRSEIDHINGLVVRRGDLLGIATPVNRVLHTLVKLVEQKQAG